MSRRGWSRKLQPDLVAVFGSLTLHKLDSVGRKMCGLNDQPPEAISAKKNCYGDATR